MVVVLLSAVCNLDIELQINVANIGFSIGETSPSVISVFGVAYSIGGLGACCHDPSTAPTLKAVQSAEETTNSGSIPRRCAAFIGPLYYFTDPYSVYYYTNSETPDLIMFAFCRLLFDMLGISA